MRERYLEVFDQISIDCLNGDKYKTGKLTPEGEPDPSVFSTESNREGIQVGTAIALLTKTGHGDSNGRIRYRDLWGKTSATSFSASALSNQPRRMRMWRRPFHSACRLRRNG